MFLLIDKPKGITSHDVIDRLREITGIRKIGHAGTLDPNATGLLVVGIGRDSTKRLGGIAKNTKKTYEAEIFLGEERDTDDVEGKIVKKFQSASWRTKTPKLQEIKHILDGFAGEQNQIPPTYSAIKLKGKKAYQLARKGQKFSLSPRKITIHSIKLLSFSYPTLCIRCCVSSGTYIRALARDIGRKLGSGAYLKDLRRTQIGEYLVKNSAKLKSLTRDNWKEYLSK